MQSSFPTTTPAVSLTKLESDATLTRIQQTKGIEGTLVLDQDGVVVKTTFEKSQTIDLTRSLGPFCAEVRNAVRNIDPSDDLAFMRIRTQNREILVASDEEFTVVALQSSTGRWENLALNVPFVD